MADTLSDEMKQKRAGVNLMIATPCYNGGITVQYLESVVCCIQELNALGIQVSLNTMANESLITRARNLMVSTFMENSRFTHMLFIDSDVGFPPQAILDLLDADFDVSACPYPRKTYDFSKLDPHNPDPSQCTSYIINLFPSTEGPTASKLQVPVYKHHFIETCETGTGFMLVKRGALERMRAAYPELRHCLDTVGENRNKMIDGFFDVMTEPGTRRYLSEDYAFCRRWRDMGGKVYLCTRHNLTHTGNHIFRGDFLKSLT